MRTRNPINTRFLYGDTLHFCAVPLPDSSARPGPHLDCAAVASCTYLSAFRVLFYVNLRANLQSEEWRRDMGSNLHD